MISWTRFITGASEEFDNLRFSNLNHTGPVVVWNITESCNLNCIHCYLDAKDKPSAFELDTTEAKNFIKDISKLKVPVLLFSGGEPLLRKDIFELAKFAQDNGIKPALSTNGTLITTDIASKIKDSGFFYVGISIDGLSEINDIFRQKKGEFKEALRGIRNCKRLGLKVGLRFTITKKNFRQIPLIFDLAKEENIERLCFYHLVYSGRAGALTTQDLHPKLKRDVLEFILKKTHDFYRNGLNTQILTVDNHADGPYLYLRLKKENPDYAHQCLRLLEANGGNGSGIKITAVDSVGNIYPDQFWRSRSLGNIRKKSFSQIWNDITNPFLANLRNRKSLLKGRCQRCGFILICNGNFRARAEAVYGDPWAEDPACYLTEEEIRERL